MVIGVGHDLDGEGGDDHVLTAGIVVNSHVPREEDLLVGALGDGVLQVEDLFGHLLDEYASTVDLRVFAPASSILGADLDLDEDVLWPVEMGDQMGHRDGAHLGGHDIGCRSIAITELSDVDAATILKDDLVLEDLLVVVVRFGPCHDHLVDVEGGGIALSYMDDGQALGRPIEYTLGYEQYKYVEKHLDGRIDDLTHARIYFGISDTITKENVFFCILPICKCFCLKVIQKYMSTINTFNIIVYMITFHKRCIKFFGAKAMELL